MGGGYILVAQTLFFPRHFQYRLVIIATCVLPFGSSFSYIEQVQLVARLVVLSPPPPPLARMQHVSHVCRGQNPQSRIKW